MSKSIFPEDLNYGQKGEVPLSPQSILIIQEDREKFASTWFKQGVAAFEGVTFPTEEEVAREFKYYWDEDVKKESLREITVSAHSQDIKPVEETIPKAWWDELKDKIETALTISGNTEGVKVFGDYLLLAMNLLESRNEKERSVEKEAGEGGSSS